VTQHGYQNGFFWGAAHMDPVTAITGAIVAGAIIAVKDTAASAIKDAYQGLRTLIVENYKLTSIATLEKNPSASVYQEGVKQEISDTPNMLDDEKVLQQVKMLTDAIEAEPEEKLAAWGVTVKDVKAYSNVVIKRISGTGGGMKAETITSEKGSITLSDIHGGPKQGK
jgi:hypothetical protein